MVKVGEMTMHLYDSELYMQDVCAVASMIQVQERADLRGNRDDRKLPD